MGSAVAVESISWILQGVCAFPRSLILPMPIAAGEALQEKRRILCALHRRAEPVGKPPLSTIVRADEIIRLNGTGNEGPQNGPQKSVDSV